MLLTAYLDFWSLIVFALSVCLSVYVFVSPCVFVTWESTGSVLYNAGKEQTFIRAWKASH